MKRGVVLFVLILSGVVPAAAQYYMGGPLEIWTEYDDPGNAKLNYY